MTKKNPAPPKKARKGKGAGITKKGATPSRKPDKAKRASLTKKKRAMSPKKASEVKIKGHANEEHFAQLIGGEVNKGSHTDKKDVIDKHHRSHSVKSGAYWQVFLYGRDRLSTDIIFQGLGDIADIMVACIDSYPKEYGDYLKDKKASKLRLQPNMRHLLKELQKPKILASFFDKALFDGGNADFLSLYPGPARDDEEKKEFHVFHKDDVVDALMKSISLRNSKARTKSQMDDQKVVFDSELHGRSMGEIEDRHDSKGHYREMKCRFKSSIVFDILGQQIEEREEPYPRVFTYGKARRLLKKRK